MSSFSKRAIGISFAVLLLPLLAAVILAARPAPISGQARFLGQTNSPTLGPVALFELKNTSRVTVKREGCWIDSEYIQIDPVHLPPGAAENIEVRFSRELNSRLHAEFRFSRPQSMMEESRERADAILSTFGIRIPGLSPDPSPRGLILKAVLEKN